MKPYAAVATVLTLAGVLLTACGGDSGAGGRRELPTIDPTTISGTVELSGVPADGSVIVVNQRYYLMWQRAKARISPVDTTLEALAQEGLTEGEPALEPLAVGSSPVSPAPRWLVVSVEVQDDQASTQRTLYVVLGNQYHRVQLQPLTAIAEAGIPDSNDPTAIDRVQLAAGTPATASPTP